MKSTIGDTFKLRSSPITRGNMKQLYTTMSSTKAKHMTSNSGAKESCVAKEGFIEVQVLDSNEPTSHNQCVTIKVQSKFQRPLFSFLG
jgi:hypothetical protein